MAFLSFSAGFLVQGREPCMDLSSSMCNVCVNWRGEVPVVALNSLVRFL